MPQKGENRFRKTCVGKWAGTLEGRLIGTRVLGEAKGRQTDRTESMSGWGVLSLSPYR